MNLNVPSVKTPGAASPSLLPPGSTASATGNPRNKTALKPGHSLMDWIRLGNSGKDLTGVGGKRIEVTPQELARHNEQGDAWIAIRGSVFNITPYMEFHPGGVEELMRGAGMDGTQLFDEVHKWVNYQSMLAKCYVGKLKQDVSPKQQQKGTFLQAGNTSQQNGLTVPATPPKDATFAVPTAPPPKAGFAVPPTPPPKSGFAVPTIPPPGLVVPSSPGSRPASSIQKPRYDWFQNDSDVIISIFTKNKESIRHEDVIIDCQNGRKCTLHVKMPRQKQTYTISLNLEAEITTQYKVQVSKATGKVDVVLTKANKTKWLKLGDPQNGDGEVTDDDSTETDADDFHTCTVTAIAEVSHDTRLYTVTLPAGYRMSVPLGYHVYVKGKVQDMDIVRAYTVVPFSLHDKEKEEDVGRNIHLMIKLYSDGALTNEVIKPLEQGDPVTLGKVYGGDFDAGRLSPLTHLVLVAAGTGFTPMAGLIKYMLNNHKQIQVILLFFNKTVKDILLKEELDKLASQTPSLKVVYILSAPDSEWSGPTGRICEDLLTEHLPKQTKESSIMLGACGPTPFTNEAIRLAKDAFQYTDDMVHAFLG